MVSVGRPEDVARGRGITLTSQKPVHSKKLPSMPEGRGAPKLHPVWPEFRSAVFGLCAEVMADQVQAAIDNGRELRQLMNEAGCVT